MDIERPSLLSSDGRDDDRSLKNFVTFDAPQLQDNLPAPEALRPGASSEFPFVLPPALAQVEKEDRIVQAAIDDPSSVRSDFLEESINTNLLPLKQTHSPPPISSRATQRMEEAAAAAAHAAEEKRRSDAYQTKRRRGLFAWLFGGGERRAQPPMDINLPQEDSRGMDVGIGRKKFADAHVAPIMDDEEEAFRRAQFVRGANGGRTKSGPRLSWGRRSMERKQRQSTERNSGQRNSKGLGGSAKNIWNKIKRSASFTFGQKRSRNNGHNGNDEQQRREPPMVAGLQDDPIIPSSSFIQRKMASLRENTAKRMVNAGKQNQRDVFNIPLERREDRPRKSNNILINGEHPGSTENKAPRPTLDQLISARPDLHYATSEAVEKLANRINSDLSQGTTLRSMSFGSKVLNGALENSQDGLDMGHAAEDQGGSNPKLQESLISSSEGAQSNSFDSFAPVMCEEESATDIISDRLRAFTKSNNIGNFNSPQPTNHGRGASGCLSPGSGHSGSRELRLSNTSRMSIELLRARAAQMPLRPTEMDIEFSPPNTKTNFGQIPIGAVAEAKRRRKKMVGEYEYGHEHGYGYRNGGRNNGNRNANDYRRGLVEEFQTEVGNTIRDDQRRMERQATQKKRYQTNNGHNPAHQEVRRSGSGGGINNDTRDARHIRDVRKDGIRERSRRSMHHDDGDNSAPRYQNNETAKRTPSVTERINALNGAIATQKERHYKEERISQIPHIRRNMATSGAIAAINASAADNDIDIRKMDIGSSGLNNTGSSNDEAVYPSDLETFCECGCSCVYEADCKHCHDAQSCCSSVGRSGRSGRTISGSGRSGMSGGKPKAVKSGISVQSEESGSNGGKRFYSPSAQSPSLSVINGNRASMGKTAPSNEAWMETMMTRVEKIERAGGNAIPRNYNANNHGGSGSFGNGNKVSTDWAARYGKTRNGTVGATGTTGVVGGNGPKVVKLGRPVSTPATSPASSDKRVSSIELDNDVLSGRIFANTVAYSNSNSTPNSGAGAAVKSSSRKLLGRFRK